MAQKIMGEKLMKNRQRKMDRQLRNKRPRQNGTINAFRAMIREKGERFITRAGNEERMYCRYQFPPNLILKQWRGATIVRVR